jgi:hypothetical protein
MPVHRRMCLCLDPTAKHAAARKYKRMLPIDVDHRQFQIAVKWCRCYGLPFHSGMIGQLFSLGLDHYQTARRCRTAFALHQKCQFQSSWKATPSSRAADCESGVLIRSPKPASKTGSRRCLPRMQDMAAFHAGNLSASPRCNAYLLSSINQFAERTGKIDRDFGGQ